MYITVLDITNISGQLISFGYSSISPIKNVTNVPAENSGILTISIGSFVSIEESRVELPEIEDIYHRKLISFKRRKVKVVDTSPQLKFDIAQKNYFIGFPVVITPTNIIGGDIKYWDAQGLPSGYSLDENTGVVTGPVSAVPFTGDFYLTAVDVNDHIYTVHYTVNIVSPDLIDFTILTTTPNKVVTLPLIGPQFVGYRSPTLINFWVDWGDGSNLDYIDSKDSSLKVHTYVSPDSYDIKIHGELDAFRVDSNSIVSVITSINSIVSNSLTHFNVSACQLLTDFPDISNCPNLVDVERFVLFCTSLTGSIPGNVFANNPKLNNVYAAFAACYGLSGSVPSALFANSPLLENVSACFSSTPITSIPSSLFDNNPLIKNFSFCFNNTDIVSIPSALFANNPLLETVEACFSATPIASIPSSLFDNNPLLKNASKCFQFSSVTSLPSVLFDNNPLLETVVELFRSCYDTTGSVPSAIFANNYNLKNAESAFYSCRSLTGSIPSTIFDNNPLLENVRECFYDCRSLTGSIPSTIFDNNPNLKNAYGTFQSLSAVSGAAFPVGIFDNNPLLEDVTYCFENTELTGTIPPNLFANNPNLKYTKYFISYNLSITGTIPSNLFANNPLLEDVNFYLCTSLTGTIPSNLFANNPLLEDVSGLFSGNDSMSGSIPSNLFDNNPNLKDVSGCFSSSGIIGSIPSNLFANNLNIENIAGLSQGSNAVSVAPNVFDNLLNCKYASGAISGNTGITSLPIGLWNNFIRCSAFDNMFVGTNIDAASIDDWLVAVDTYNIATGYRVFSYSGTLTNAHLDINRSPAALAAKNSLISKGWILSGSY